MVGWDIFYLTMCWALTLTTSTLLTTIGPLSAKELGVADSLAAFTIGIFLFGAAFSAVPSGELFRRYGRYIGFTIGCGCQVCGSLVGGIGMVSKRSELLYLGCFLTGLGQGLGQFYRFAAIEIAPSHLKSVAVTYVLSGGVIAAVIGPTIAKFSSKILITQYTGCFLVMGFLGLANWFILSLVAFPKVLSNIDGMGEQMIFRLSRPLREIISQPLFILSCSVATIAHTVMVMVMSNCALAMSDNYSLGKSSLVLEMHFLAMFSPGFVSGNLIKTYGPFKMSIVGAVLFAFAAIVFGLGTEIWNFYAGMVLLGIAWNFAYSSATVMLIECYEPHEAPHVQATNDFILFTTAGVGCLASGFVYSYFSWSVLIYVASVMMGINFLLFVAVWGLDANPERKGNAELLDETDDSSLLNDERRSSRRMDSIEQVRRISVA